MAPVIEVNLLIFNYFLHISTKLEGNTFSYNLNNINTYLLVPLPDTL